MRLDPSSDPRVCMYVCMQLAVQRRSGTCQRSSRAKRSPCARQLVTRSVASSPPPRSPHRWTRRSQFNRQTAQIIDCRHRNFSQRWGNSFLRRRCAGCTPGCNRLLLCLTGRERAERREYSTYSRHRSTARITGKRWLVWLRGDAIVAS